MTSRSRRTLFVLCLLLAGALVGAGLLAPSAEATAPATLSTTSLAFGNVHVGTPVAKNITVKLAPGYVLSGLSGSTYGSWAASESLPCATPGSQTCVVTQTFKPQVLGTQSRSLSITVCQQADPDACTTYVVKVSGTGVIPATFTPASIAFSTVPVGSTKYVAEKVTIDKGFYLDSATPADSAFDSVHFAADCVRSGGTCTFDFSFHPVQTGAVSSSAQIELCPDDGSNMCVGKTIALTGTGGEPGTGGPATLAFGQVHIGKTLTKTITIKVLAGNHIGSFSLIDNDNLPGEFSLGDDEFPCFADGPLTCTFSVSFLPGDQLARATIVRTLVCENSSNHCKAYDTKVTGTGVLPGTVSPSPLAFGSTVVGTSVAKPVTLTMDAGWRPVEADFVGVDPTQFSDNSTDACGSLPVTATKCAFSTWFEARHIGGNAPEHLVVRVCEIDNADFCVDLKPVNVTATGLAPGKTSVASLAFGSVKVYAVAHKTFTLSADDGWYLQGFGGSGNAEGSGWGVGVPPGCDPATAACTVTQTFAPAWTGSYAATTIATLCNDAAVLCVDLPGVKLTGTGALTATATKLVSNTTQGKVDHSELLTATVSPAPSDGGSVTFYDGTRIITGCFGEIRRGGTVQCGWTPTTSGSHSLKAVFSGTNGYQSSTSPVLSRSVAAS